MLRQQGHLLTWNGDVVGQWKEPCEDFLNPANMSSWKKSKYEDLGKDSFRYLTEFTEQLSNGRVPGVVDPEMLTALDCHTFSLSCGGLGHSLQSGGLVWWFPF